MTPIHELLNRIRWDKEFGQGRFEIGYHDRHEHALQRVAFEEIVFPAGERRVFEVVDESGADAQDSVSPHPRGRQRRAHHLAAASLR